MLKIVNGIIFISVLISLQNCRPPNTSSNQPGSLAIIAERDLIPEGTAYDPVTGQVFVSSIYKRKIIAIRKDGTYYDFISEGQDSIWATLGMEVDTNSNKLWVISGKGSQGIPNSECV